MKWFSIESAPLDGTPVLVFDGEVALAWYEGEFGWRSYHGDGDPRWDPTHWMPLPDPPQQSEDGDRKTGDDARETG